MDLRGGMGQIDHGLDGHGKEFQLYPKRNVKPWESFKLRSLV